MQHENRERDPRVRRGWEREVGERGEEGENNRKMRKNMNSNLPAL